MIAKDFAEAEASVSPVRLQGDVPRPATHAFLPHLNADVLVVGGGCAGLAAALFARRQGASVILVDRAPASSTQAPARTGQTFILTRQSVELLRKLGVWCDLRAKAYPVDRIHVSDKLPSTARDTAPLAFASTHKDPTPLVHVLESESLLTALKARVAATAGISILPDASLETLSEDANGARAVLSGGQCITSALVVGCDGRASPTAALLGIAGTACAFDHWALVCTLCHPPRNARVAHQMLTSAGPFSVLPLGSDTSSLLWTAPPPKLNALVALNPHTLAQRIEDRVGGLLGPIDLVGEPAVFPLESRVARRFSRGRTVLLGDAAHVFHPVTGQGLNYGFRDIAALASVFQAARLGEARVPRRLLLRYANARRLDALAMSATTRAIVGLFGTGNRSISALARAGLSTLGAMPRVQTFLIRRAGGHVGRLRGTGNIGT